MLPASTRPRPHGGALRGRAPTRAPRPAALHARRVQLIKARTAEETLRIARRFDEAQATFQPAINLAPDERVNAEFRAEVPGKRRGSATLAEQAPKK